MRIVLDASVTLCWCFKDERHRVADRTAALLLQNPVAIAPTIWWYEIRNAMTMGLRRKRLTQDSISSFLSDLALLKIELDPVPNEGRVFDLAERHRLTFYDASYLELALREQGLLASLDTKLMTAARAEGAALLED